MPWSLAWYPFLVINVLQASYDYLLEHLPNLTLFHIWLVINVLQTYHDYLLEYLLAWYLFLMINVLQTYHDYLLEHLPDLMLFHIWLVINVLQTCHDYSLEYLLALILVLSDLRAANMPWSFVWIFTYFDINAIKTHFAMKTLKRVNIIMWALQTRLARPGCYGLIWPWDTMVWVLYALMWLAIDTY